MKRRRKSYKFCNVLGPEGKNLIMLYARKGSVAKNLRVFLFGSTKNTQAICWRVSVKPVASTLFSEFNYQLTCNLTLYKNLILLLTIILSTHNLVVSCLLQEARTIFQHLTECNCEVDLHSTWNLVFYNQRAVKINRKALNPWHCRAVHKFYVLITYRRLIVFDISKWSRASTLARVSMWARIYYNNLSVIQRGLRSLCYLLGK